MEINVTQILRKRKEQETYSVLDQVEVSSDQRIFVIMIARELCFILWTMF